MLPCETYQTPLLDLTQATLGIELVPAKPGYIPIGLTSIWLIETSTGTQTTPPSIQAGNDSAHTNIMANTSTTPSNANAASCVGNTPALAGGPSTASAAQLAAQHNQNAAVVFDVTAGGQGTGGYTLKGKLVLVIMWQAVG